MSEIAMVASRKSRLEADAKKGDGTAQKALELARNPGKFFSTIQIGITLIGILTGIYSGAKIEDDVETWLNQFAWLREYSATIAVAIIVVSLTFLSLLFGELIPKRIGHMMPETITKSLAYPMYWISIIVSPFTLLLTVTSDFFIKLFRIKSRSDGKITEEEIKSIIHEATETGVVQEIEQDIVENVFHLGDRKINTLMTLRESIDWINSGESLDAAKSKIISSVHKLLPVGKESIDNINGVVTSKDLLNALLAGNEFEIEKQVKPLLKLDENATAYNALKKLRESKTGMAIVTDETGKVTGILTMTDLVDTLVGDFAQQLHEKREIIPRSDGSFLVDADVSLAEFARYFEVDLSGDVSLSDIDTIGELVTHEGKKFPVAGDVIKWKNLRVEIVDMDASRVDKVLVKKAADDKMMQ